MAKPLATEAVSATVLDTWIARVAGGIMFGATVGALLSFRLAARRTRGLRDIVARRQPARWAESLWIPLTLVNLLWPAAVLALPQVAYAWPVPDFPDAADLQLLGFVVWAVGGILAVWTVRTLGRYMTPEIRVERDHRLVEDGPYHAVRHPMYLSAMAMGMGSTLAFLSPMALGVTLLIAVIANHRAALEEDLLRSPEAFGATYDAYMTKTGRFMPKVRR